jgi:hypothetical protein
VFTKADNGNTVINTVLAAGLQLLWEGTVINTVLAAGLQLLWEGTVINTVLAAGQLLWEGTVINTVLAAGLQLLWEGIQQQLVRCNEDVIALSLDCKTCENVL